VCVHTINCLGKADISLQLGAGCQVEQAGAISCLMSVRANTFCDNLCLIHFKPNWSIGVRFPDMNMRGLAFRTRMCLGALFLPGVNCDSKFVSCCGRGLSQCWIYEWSLQEATCDGSINGYGGADYQRRRKR
jgi:hypothetical protein